MTAAPGSTIAARCSRPRRRRRPRTSRPSRVNENEALVVGVTTGGATDPYWIRCLPHDFPKLQMTPVPRGRHPASRLLPRRQHHHGPRTQWATRWRSTATACPSGTTRRQTGSGAVDVDSVVPGTISYVPTFPSRSAPTRASSSCTISTRGRRRYVVSRTAPRSIRTSFCSCRTATTSCSPSPITHGRRPHGARELRPRRVHHRLRSSRRSTRRGRRCGSWVATDHFDPVKDSTWPADR